MNQVWLQTFKTSFTYFFISLNFCSGITAQEYIWWGDMNLESQDYYLSEMASEKKPFSHNLKSCPDDLRKERKQNISDCSVKLAILIRGTNLFLLWEVSSGHVTGKNKTGRNIFLADLRASASPLPHSSKHQPYLQAYVLLCQNRNKCKSLMRCRAYPSQVCSPEKQWMWISRSSSDVQKSIQNLFLVSFFFWSFCLTLSVTASQILIAHLCRHLLTH